MANTQTAVKSKTNKLLLLVLSALFAAMITVMTAFLFHIPIGVNGGYLHFGDALIYLAASMLPTPYACIAAAVGAGLADIVSGAPIWAPFTLVIKACIALLLPLKKKSCSINAMRSPCWAHGRSPVRDTILRRRSLRATGLFLRRASRPIRSRLRAAQCCLCSLRSR